MALSEIVNVSIQAGTVNPARRGFGVPLIMAYHTAWAGSEVRTYSTFAGLAVDFPATTSGQRSVNLMAAQMFSQNPRPSTIKVGRLPTPGSNQAFTIDAGDMATGVDIVGSIVGPDGTATAINVTWNTSLALTLADLEAAIDAIVGLEATAASPLVTVVENVTAGEQFSLSFTTAGVDVKHTSSDWGYDTALTAAEVIDPEFYAVVIDENSPKNMDKVARWALTNDRLAAFGPQYTKPSQFTSAEFTSDPADHTALMANDSAFSLFTKEPRVTFKECAWLGDMLPRDPGSATWAFKTLDGVGADSMTSTERTLIEASAHKGNHYVAEAGVGITRPGKAHGGEWLDVVRGLDWLQARLEERLFSLLVNNPKIPYTDDGIAMVEAEVRAQLREAESRGLIDAGWTTTVLAAADQATADRAARILRDVEFQARLAGAIHSINVAGTITV
jgi:hypothetical protein